MTKISSSATFYYKWVFPIVWFGVLGLAIVVALVDWVVGGPLKIPLLSLFVPIVMIAFGYFLMRLVVFGLVDQVWDAGSELIVRNRGREVAIPLANIINVNYLSFSNPPRVTLLLRDRCELGDEISYMPTSRGAFVAIPRPVRELIARIDTARLQAAAESAAQAIGEER